MTDTSLRTTRWSVHHDCFDLWFLCTLLYIKLIYITSDSLFKPLYSHALRNTTRP
uniref:Uncharacterized protein n=1 Tax=Anguilla anguilla TaxID=7936 RepID=A0A0E9X1P0_ANGAN